jgi:hypothetical protein
MLDFVGKVINAAGKVSVEQGLRSAAKEGKFDGGFGEGLRRILLCDSIGRQVVNSKTPSLFEENEGDINSKGSLLTLSEPEDFGQTALHLAAKNGHTAAMECLLDHSASLNMTDETNGMTALHFAAAAGHTDAIKCLLDRGASRNAEDKRGLTPLHHAGTKAKQEKADLDKKLKESQQVYVVLEKKWNESKHANVESEKKWKEATEAKARVEGKLKNVQDDLAKEKEACDTVREKVESLQRQISTIQASPSMHAELKKKCKDLERKHLETKR